MVQKSFGFMFAYVSAAPEALVSYFKGFGGQQDGKEDSGLMVNMPDPSPSGNINDGLRLNNSYLIQYVLTLDLRLETCFTNVS